MKFVNHPMLSYVFSDKDVFDKCIISYETPYMALFNRDYSERLCLIENNHIIQILDTERIFVKLTIAYSEKILFIFEKKYPHIKIPRKALDKAKQYLLRIFNSKEDTYEWIMKQLYNLVDNNIEFINIFYRTLFIAHQYYHDTFNIYGADIINEILVEIVCSSGKLDLINIFQSIVDRSYILILLAKSNYSKINNKLQIKNIPRELLEKISTYI